MLKWDDKGIVLSTKTIGEDAILLNVFTKIHGKHLGIIKKTKTNTFLQSGNYISVNWQARLDEQLGYYKAELITPYASYNLMDNLNLSIVTSACALVDMSQYERQENIALFDRTLALMEDITPRNYCLWELSLLKNSGFELDIEKCGVCGENDDLSYVSPKTGRAISKSVGFAYHDKLFKYPAVFKDKNATDYIQGLQVTGFFLQNHILNKLPDARARLIRRLSK